MKRFLFFLLKKAVNSIAAILLAIIIYFLGASAISLIPVNSHTQHSDTSVAIYIRTNGVHTDIVVPATNHVTDWKQMLPPAQTLAANSQLGWLSFGWGDKGFYLQTPTWYQLKPSVAFKALFHLGTSAMHTSYSSLPAIDETCRRILISEKQYLQLVAYITSSFRLSNVGNTINIAGKHYGSNDAFYEGQGTYSLFYTCNTWANNALKACGQKACLWTPFDKAIFRWYDTGS